MSGNQERKVSSWVTGGEALFKAPVQSTLNQINGEQSRILKLLRGAGLNDPDLEEALLRIATSSLIMAIVNHSTEGEENRRMLQVGATLLATSVQLASALVKLKVSQREMFRTLSDVTIATSVSNEVKLGELAEKLAKKARGETLSKADKRALAMVRAAYRQVKKYERTQREANKTREKVGGPYA